MPSFCQVSRNWGWYRFQDLSRSNAFLLGADRDGGAVGVAAGNHEDFVAGHAVVAGEDVGGQVATGNVSQVKGPVGIGPGDADEDAFRQVISLGDVLLQAGSGHENAQGYSSIPGLRAGIFFLGDILGHLRRGERRSR